MFWVNGGQALFLRAYQGDLFYWRGAGAVWTGPLNEEQENDPRISLYLNKQRLTLPKLPEALQPTGKNVWFTGTADFKAVSGTKAPADVRVKLATGLDQVVHGKARAVDGKRK